jgi:hypothetical protein
MRSAALALWIGASIAAIAAIGCERHRPTARVTGRVTVDDKPITDAAIVLMADDGSYQDSARVRANGEFLVEAAPVGKVKVGVIVRTPPPARPQPGKPLPPRPVAVLSQKYADPQQSGLTMELVEGDNASDVRIFVKR